MAELTTTTGKSRRKGSRLHQAPRIDLTAMVDLAFLLITFFILATSLSKPKALSLALPVKGPAQARPESRTMTICLGKNNLVLWYMGMPERPLSVPRLIDFGKNGLRATLLSTNKQVLQRSGKPLIVILKPSAH